MIILRIIVYKIGSQCQYHAAMIFHIRMAGPSRIEVSMELQVSDLAMELQILVLCQISDHTMKTDFISCTRLIGSGASSQKHELHQHRQRNSDADEIFLSVGTWSIDH